MHIDELKVFTSWRKLKRSKRFSDHCAIKFSIKFSIFSIKFSILKSLEQAKSSKRIKVWNFNDPEGWKKFYTLTK